MTDIYFLEVLVIYKNLYATIFAIISSVFSVLKTVCHPISHPLSVVYNTNALNVTIFSMASIYLQTRANTSTVFGLLGLLAPQAQCMFYIEITST